MRGICADEKGKPVYGCVIRADGILYSNNRGEWSIRVKNTKPQPIEVVPAVFAALGNWRVVSASIEAAADKPVEIVVGRIYDNY